MEIYITAILKAKPEHLEEVKATLQNVAMESPKEEANLKYDLHRAIEDENTFTLYEIWENEAGLAAHHEETYFKALVKLIEEGKLQEPPIIIPTSKM